MKMSYKVGLGVLALMVMGGIKTLASLSGFPFPGLSIETDAVFSERPDLDYSFLKCEKEGEAPVLLYYKNLASSEVKIKTQSAMVSRGGELVSIEQAILADVYIPVYDKLKRFVKDKIERTSIRSQDAIKQLTTEGLELLKGYDTSTDSLTIEILRNRLQRLARYAWRLHQLSPEEV